MTKVVGFPPVAARDAKVLILGSMPGVRSLVDKQYYAQPRNAFWPIMGTLFHAGPELPYRQRLKVLVANEVALWDVLRCCERPGSLDSSIDGSTAEPNDFAHFFAQHSQIKRIFFNGLMASRVFLRQVQPGLTDPFASLPTVILPSTSPVHAAMTLDEKKNRWSVISAALRQA